MGRTRPPYPADFRAEAVRLARSSDRSVPQLARELGVSPQTLTNWIAQDRVDAGESCPA
jgi:transposase